MQKPQGVWKKLPSAPLYEISDEGQVWSTPRPRTKGGLIKQRVNKQGYLRVTLTVDGKHRYRPVHQLVAEAFLGDRPKGLETLHIDGNKLDCSVSNLRYGTSRENKTDSVKHGSHHNAGKTSCPRGHLLEEGNLVRHKIKIGARQCLICERKRHELQRQRKRSA